MARVAGLGLEEKQVHQALGERGWRHSSGLGLRMGHGPSLPPPGNPPWMGPWEAPKLQTGPRS